VRDRVGQFTASSRKGFDDAVRLAVERAERTTDHVNGAQVLDQQVVVRQGRVVEYRVTVAVSVDALVSVDEGQTIVDFNRGAEAVFGYARDEALGQPLETLIPERFRAAHDENVRGFQQSAVRERMMGERDRIVGLRKDGTEFPAEASIARRTVDGRARYSVLLRELVDR
jgi:PAS domain S-box-containing protein